MRYFDKDGEPMTRENWEAAIRSPTYDKVAKDSYGNTSVTTSWIGIQTVLDERPTMFVTILKIRGEDPDIYWLPCSLAKAKAFHLHCVKDAKIPIEIA